MLGNYFQLTTFSATLKVQFVFYDTIFYLFSLFCYQKRVFFISSLKLISTQEQIEWAVAEKADYIIGETFDAYGEAKLALDAILKHGNGKKTYNEFLLSLLVQIDIFTFLKQALNEYSDLFNRS